MRNNLERRSGVTSARGTGVRFGSVLLSAWLILAVAGCAPSSPPLPSPSRSQPVSAAPGIRDAASALTSNEVFAGGLYVDLQNHASLATSRLKAAGDSDTASITRISSQPTAIWLGDQYSAAQIGPLLARYVASANAAGRTLVFVTYAIPHRDCGGLSAGGFSPAKYSDWNEAIATALRGSNAVVLVEPDSLAMLTEKKCAAERDSRPAVIRRAVNDLVTAGLTVYLDGGNSHWVKAETMAGLLNAAGVADTRGFFTNVSNFYRVDQERANGQKLAALVGNKHFVVDVSRNGTGWRGTWCNPSGAALGQDPHVSAGTTSLDALLWVKHPGDSDGSCNGGPKAGMWWEEYALDLVRNSSAE